ncbi:7-dehydrocholesterol reductase [Eurytemora carolleeae]|uniref:7-dehydrocholesterol reductase n=1 Tax=Eurytemora carolleeae TaxID=1294199 RepID=UPI000C786C76|nr:7-dehydrocholesterol reductase [Eurytemora carolleeae]|eukprot:XP_023330159.1 7-dehydrocholesterol reductase-like [Eurytemora affinis]
MYDLVRYYIIPPIFLVFFTGVTQVLVSLGNPYRPFELSSLFNPGTQYSWTVVSIFMFWAFLSLKIPSKEFLGPTTPAGYTPRDFCPPHHTYIIGTSVVTSCDPPCTEYRVFVHPDLPLDIFSNFGDIVASLNLFSLIFCAYLLVKGRLFPEVNEGATDKPLPYQFYAGIELHPRLFGVDIKQWTNCRVGMLGWALLVLNFSIASSQLNSFKLAPFSNSVLINLYLLKFFYWETGYFNTLDITLDRAGYYLCWGCLTWVQVFYTFSAYYLVAQPSKVSDSGAFAIFLFGLISLILNYWADYQKEIFKARDGECTIWGRKAKFVPVQYIAHDGKKRKSKLLISGFWGVSRHLNYVWELLLALSWSLPGLGSGPWTFMYFIFLVVLLVHRTFRDEEKCSSKYGKGWTEYCKLVQYRLIPYIF